jgi:hypothetical protein
MSRGARGRQASLPSAGYRPAPRRRDAEGLVVRYVPESPAEEPRDFDFTTWTASVEMKLAFASAFAARTRPGGRVRTLSSANKTWQILRQFNDYLTELVTPPTTPAHLTRAHLHGWYLARRDHAGVNMRLCELKLTLRKMDDLSVEFLDALNERNPTRLTPTGHKHNYSRAENERILGAARSDVRRAAQRIREGRELVRRFRTGELRGEPDDVRRLGKLLSYVDTHADVPRSKAGQHMPRWWVSELGTVPDHVFRLYLSGSDVAAFAVLLVGLTGQNPSTIFRAPATHHRPDGYSGEIPSALVKLNKPRRGARQHMDVPFTAVPPWAQPGMPADPAGQTYCDSLDLRSPFGVYRLLHELAAPARSMLGTDRLFVWCALTGGPGRRRGLHTTMHANMIQAWSREHALVADAPGERLIVTLQRMRLTFNELQQRPVAHTTETLANEYLARNRGNLVEYQQVVAAALAEQVMRAETRGLMLTLSADDVAQARQDPSGVAARYGMDGSTLQRMLAGELDTVLGACVDQTNSPHADAGQPCRASFMLCLSCPCARAMPTHLAVQALVYDELGHRKSAVTPLRWAQRFALAHNQLGDLLERAGEVAVADARAAVTPAQRQLVQRFLNRELDIA